MGKTSSWKNPTIKVLRVPIVFATILKRIARDLDNLEPDQEFIFTYRLTNAEALQTEKFYDAAETVFKVTNKNLAAAAIAAIEAIASEGCLPARDEEDEEDFDSAETPETEPLCQCSSHYELDLSTLVSDVSELEAVDEPDEAQPDEALQESRQENEPNPLNMDAWQTAIGSVELATSHHTPAVARPEALGLLELSELSTLFALPAAETCDFDPDAVIESVLVHEAPTLEDFDPDFDPDAVIASIEAQTLASETNQNPDKQLHEASTATDIFDPDVVIEAIEAAVATTDIFDPDAVIEAIEAAVATEIETNDCSLPQRPTGEAVTATTVPATAEPQTQPTTVKELDEIGLDLPRITIPKLTPLNQSFFAAQLFATWQRLAVQKLLEQQRPEAEPWGVAVELNEIYRAQFSALLGNHFLQGIEGVVLNPADGKKIQLIATPGIVNPKIAGVDANAISYESDHSGHPQGKQQRQQPSRVRATSSQPEITPPQTVLEPTPQRLDIEDSDRARLLKERQRRIATTRQSQEKPRHWFKRLLSL